VSTNQQGTSRIEQEQYYAQNRSEWRCWLEKNHATSSGVWLISYKQHTGQTYVAYSDAVEEAHRRRGEDRQRGEVCRPALRHEAWHPPPCRLALRA